MLIGQEQRHVVQLVATNLQLPWQPYNPEGSA